MPKYHTNQAKQAAIARQNLTKAAEADGKTLMQYLMAPKTTASNYQYWVREWQKAETEASYYSRRDLDHKAGMYHGNAIGWASR